MTVGLLGCAGYLLARKFPAERVFLGEPFERLARSGQHRDGRSDRLRHTAAQQREDEDRGSGMHAALLCPDDGIIEIMSARAAR